MDDKAAYTLEPTWLQVALRQTQQQQTQRGAGRHAKLEASKRQFTNRRGDVTGGSHM